MPMRSGGVNGKMVEGGNPTWQAQEAVPPRTGSGAEFIDHCLSVLTRADIRTSIWAASSPATCIASCREVPVVHRKPRMLLPFGGRLMTSPGLAVTLRKKIRLDSDTAAGTEIC